MLYHCLLRCQQHLLLPFPQTRSTAATTCGRSPTISMNYASVPRQGNTNSLSSTKPGSKTWAMPDAMAVNTTKSGVDLALAKLDNGSWPVSGSKDWGWAGYRKGCSFYPPCGSCRLSINGKQLSQSLHFIGCNRLRRLALSCFISNQWC